MAGQKIELGPTGSTVSANIKRVRSLHRLNYADLSRKLTELGRPISPLAVRRMEDGDRRVDVDDLMAMAVALGVNPNGLLTPESESDQQRVEITGHGETVASGVLWGWMRGKNCLNPFDDQFIFRRRTMPRWLVEQEESATRMSELHNAQVQSLLDELAKRVSNGDS